MSAQKYLLVPEVAERYRTSEKVIYEWVAGGLLPYKKLPARKRLLFDAADLDLYDAGNCTLERKRLAGPSGSEGVIVRPRRAA